LIAGESTNTGAATAVKPSATANAAVADAAASSVATIIGPIVNASSISTPSIENAIMRVRSSSKRWRHIVRVSTLIGGRKAPASAAKAITIPGARSSRRAKSTTASANGQTRPVAKSTGAGPRRSTMRPRNGPVTADAPRHLPPAAPRRSTRQRPPWRNATAAQPTGAR
jgi:hypothetical protein